MYLYTTIALTWIAAQPAAVAADETFFEARTYRFAGRDFRLTDVHGRVVREILA